jgi:hypothetical protein
MIPARLLRSIPSELAAVARALALCACVGALAACGEEESATPAPPPSAPPATAPPAAAPAPAPPAAPAAPDAPAARPSALPAGYPDDLPTYPAASAVATSQDGEEGLLVAFESADASDRIFEFYKDALAKQGWQLEGEMSSEGQHMLIANKGARKASVMISTESGKTEITVTVTKDAS